MRDEEALTLAHLTHPGSFCTVRSVEPFVCPSSPDSALTSKAGSAQCDRCADGFYRDSSEEASLLTCKLCPAHATCVNDATLDVIALLNGFWRLSATTSVIYACRSSSGGVQGPQCVGNASADRPWPHTYCIDGHEGPRCDVCTKSRHYLDRDSGACVACNVGAVIGRVIWISAIIVAIAGTTLLVAAFVFKQRRPELTLWAAAQQLTDRLLLVPMVKQLLGFFQIVVVLGTAYEVDLPDEYVDWMRSLALDFEGIVLPGVCVGGVRIRLVLLALITPSGCVIVWVLIKEVVVPYALYVMVRAHAPPNIHTQCHSLSSADAVCL